MHIAPCVRDGQAQACCTTRQAVTPSHHGASYVISTQCEYYLQLAVPDQPNAVHTIRVTANNRVKNRTGCDVLTNSRTRASGTVRNAACYLKYAPHSGSITKGAPDVHWGKSCLHTLVLLLTVLAQPCSCQIKTCKEGLERLD